MKMDEILTEEEKRIKPIIEGKLEEIRKDPYNFICDYVESLYPHVGRKVFEILSLMPCSLMIPDIPYSNKTIRSNINTLFLAPSGAGKSSIAKLFSLLTTNPLEVESITPAKLELCISQSPKFSLIIGDFARLSRDPIIIKVMEGILGEEKQIKRMTMRGEINMETDGIGLICGTPQDLSHYLSGGLLFRMIPKIILNNAEAHSEIGSHITSKIGEEGDGDVVEKSIQIFYKELEMIQTGEHPKIKKITGYYINGTFKKEALEVWNKLTQPMVRETNMNFIRGLHEFYRILISHAFLNIFNRKIVDGVLYIDGEDFKVALDIMSATIETQYDILKTERFVKSLKNLSELQRVMKDPRIKTKYKDYIKNLVSIKHGRLEHSA